MKYGMVAQIRINPEDCQSILDTMGILNIDPYDGRSFAQCVSIALSACLGAYRKAGTLPEVDPYQYLNRMGPFIGARNNKRKVAAADAFYQAGSKATATLQQPTTPVHHPGQYTPDYLRQHAREGDIIPIREEFDREEAMQEYNYLKGLCMKQEANEEQIGRFGYLQNLLY